MTDGEDNKWFKKYMEHSVAQAMLGMNVPRLPPFRLPDEWPIIVNGVRTTTKAVYQADRHDTEAIVNENRRYYDSILTKKRVEHILENQMIENIMNDGFTVLYIEGMSNSGKSFAAIQVASKHIDFYNAIKDEELTYSDNIHFATSASDAITLLHSIPLEQKGDIIVVDEDPELSGEGSRTEERAINTILAECRVRQISFIFCSPTKQQRTNMQFTLQVICYLPEYFRTITWLHSPRNRPLGWIDIDVELDHDWYQELLKRYLPDKIQNVHNLSSKWGFVGVKLTERHIECANEVHKLMIDEGVFSDKKKIILRYIRRVAKGAPKDFREAVVSYVQDKFADEETPINLKYEGQTDDLRDAVLDQLLTRGADKITIEAYRLRRKYPDKTQDSIANELGKSQATISRRLDSFGSEIGTKLLGYAFEDVYSTILENDGILHKKGGSNTAEPDIVIVDEDGTPIEIRSLKCYSDEGVTMTVPREKIGKTEQEMADKLGIPLYLVVYNIYHDRLFEPVLVTDQEKFTFSVSGGDR